jgi:Ca-activated chloride channel family protein
MHSQFRKSVLLGALLTAALPASSHAENLSIVLDGSGSMWGQIDGRPKLEIAREVLAAVLNTTPPNMSLGLVAYGHNRKGDCGDIEVLVPPGAGQADAVRDAAKQMRFLGKTPLVEATRRAAMSLRHTEQTATLVVITDGLETCGGDICSLAKELETSGVDFKAHVVGFGLSATDSAQLTCLAEETGGRFFDAQDADGLRDALVSTVAVAPPALPPAELTAPDTASRGATISVEWEGPNRAGDFIDIVDLDGVGAKAYDFVELSGVKRVDIRVPAATGSFIVRYVQPMTPEEAAAVNDGTRERTLATRTVTVVDGGEIIKAPDSVLQSSLIDASVSEEVPASSYLGVFKADTVGPGGWSHAPEIFADTPVQLHVPIEPGAYELRLVVPGAGSSFDVAATRKLTIRSAAIEMEAPQQVAAGSRFEMDWAGPVAGENWIDVTDEGETGLYGYEGYTTYTYEYVGSDAPLTLTAPTTPGRYDIRYVAAVPVGQGQGVERAVLARTTIEVLAELPSNPIRSNSGSAGEPDQTEKTPQTTLIPTEGRDIDKVVSDLFKS